MIFSTAKTINRAAKPKTRRFATLATASLALGLCFGTAQAQRSPGIASITVCSPTAPVPGAVRGSCGPGMFDTQQAVLGPNGKTVNKSGLGVDPAPDEHSTVFAPKTLGPNKEYLFFLASTVGNNPGIGVAVLSGGSGPDKNGTWSLDFSYVDGYGYYGNSVFGQVFDHPMADSVCPTVLGGDATQQDQTFDLHYAASGSVVIDPTGPAGSVLMVYEGTNSCIGNAGGAVASDNKDDYISLAIATSVDYGKNWPTYRGNPPTFTFVDMPGVNQTQGPNAFNGAFGSNVCMGNDCGTTPPAAYGRYAVVTQSPSLSYYMSQGTALMQKTGEQEISGFVDDVGGSPMPYIYVNWGDARVAQAQLNGGTAPLQFLKWNGTSFANTGLGGAEMSVVPKGAFGNCEDSSQARYGSSISYVDSTQQYLLTFLCVSPGDPNPPKGQPPSTTKGAAWFYATSYDLTTQSWSTPSEIQGSWDEFDPSQPCSTGGDSFYNGYYPSFMSLNKKAGHLSMTGFVFYLTGCQGGTPSGRTFTSRAFTITRTME